MLALGSRGGCNGRRAIIKHPGTACGSPEAEAQRKVAKLGGVVHRTGVLGHVQARDAQRAASLGDGHKVYKTEMGWLGEREGMRK